MCSLKPSGILDYALNKTNFFIPCHINVVNSCSSIAVNMLVFISSHPSHPEPEPQVRPRAHHERGVPDFGMLQKELRQPFIGRPAHLAGVHEVAAPLCQLHHQE